MRNKLFIVMIPALLLLGAKCKKDKDGPPESQLPAETQSGKNTFGALVNGQVFTPYTPPLSSLPEIDAYYLPAAGGKYFTLSIDVVNLKTAGSPAFQFRSDSIVLKSGDKLTLIRDETRPGIGARYHAADQYDIVPPLSGTIQFTRVDTQAKILSGTFSFDAVDGKGDRVEIREGRFDIAYRTN